jgi:hypothetical protein
MKHLLLNKNNFLSACATNFYKNVKPKKKKIAGLKEKFPHLATGTAVLRIRDVLSRIPDPTIAPSRIRIPDRGVKKHRNPDPTYFCIKAINKFC